MANLRELRARIRSVNSTKKITKAQELIATSRITKAQAPSGGIPSRTPTEIDERASGVSRDSGRSITRCCATRKTPSAPPCWW